MIREEKTIYTGEKLGMWKNIHYGSVWLRERKRPGGNDRGTAGEGKQEREGDERDRDERWEDVESWKKGGEGAWRKNDSDKKEDGEREIF